MIRLSHVPKTAPEWQTAKAVIQNCHYLHKYPDPRTSHETYSIMVDATLGEAGFLVFGRPEATRCGDWYGGVDDVSAGRCEVTRWQVLNLARVWLFRHYQTGGTFYKSGVVPGYVDRHGVFRSTLASTALQAAINGIGFDYLMRRPPCFLDEPYEIRWLLSYCDTRLHRGTIYAAAGFEQYRVNGNGIETWRIRVPPLTVAQDAAIREASRANPRSIGYRARRAQLALFG